MVRSATMPDAFSFLAFAKGPDGSRQLDKTASINPAFMLSISEVSFERPRLPDSPDFHDEILCRSDGLRVGQQLPGRVRTKLERVTTTGGRDFTITVRQERDSVRLEFRAGSWLGAEFERRLDLAVALIAALD